MISSSRSLLSTALAPTSGAEPRCHAWCLPGPQPNHGALSALAALPQRGELRQRRARARHGTVTSAAYGSSVDLTSWSSPSDRGSPLDFQLNGSYVAGARGRTRGIVHFVGGAFAGANPQLTVRKTSGSQRSLSMPVAVRTQFVLDRSDSIPQGCIMIVAVVKCMPADSNSASPLYVPT